MSRRWSDIRCTPDYIESGDELRVAGKPEHGDPLWHRREGEILSPLPTDVAGTAFTQPAVTERGLIECRQRPSITAEVLFSSVLAHRQCAQVTQIPEAPTGT